MSNRNIAKIRDGILPNSVADKMPSMVISDKVSAEVRNALGDKLHKIILYGSYARGDFGNESDIDIMVLADISNDELLRMEKELWDIGWDIGFEHDMMVTVFLKDTSHFYSWLEDMAYYRNILNDGVVLYG